MSEATGPRVGTVVSTHLGDLRYFQAEVVVAGLYLDERPPQGLAGLADWYLCGQVTEQILAGRITGRAGHDALVATQGAMATPRLLVVGLGLRVEITPNTLRSLWPRIFRVIRDLGVGTAGVELLGCCLTMKPETAARTLLQHAGNPGHTGELESLVILPADDREQEILERLLR
jgi:hypothetical protein